MKLPRLRAPWRRLFRSRPLPRRVLLFGAVIVLLGGAGLVPLLWGWSGVRGRAPTGRLYLPGTFAGKGPLLRLERVGGGRGREAAGGAKEEHCFRVVRPDGARLGPPVCGGGSREERVDDALVQVAVSARGVPRVSVAGAWLRVDDWIGSDAASGAGEHPRIPFRGYGIPARAARVVACPAHLRGPGLPAPAGCIRAYDRLERLAIARAGAAEPGDDATLQPGQPYALRPGDELWLGLVVFVAAAEGTGDGARLVLRRQGRASPRPGAGAVGRGGDRRWLGRLWPVELPDPSRRPPARFAVYPHRVRYSRENLSRQRTNLEAEDIVQRLVDAEFLCLDHGSGPPRVAWRPLNLPGCAGAAPGRVVAVDRETADDYQRARYGDASASVGDLLGRTNRLLEGHGYLEDATALPLAFSWRLRRADPADPAAPPGIQPVPGRLWGVRFGATRVSRTGGDRPTPLPEVRLGGGTARHVIQVWQGGAPRASLALLPPPGPSGAPPGRPAGRVCLGRYPALRGDPVTARAGTHHPLGAFAFQGDPRQGEWYPAAPGECGGCELVFEGEGAAGVRMRPGPRCTGRVHAGAPAPGGGYLLPPGEGIDVDALRLVHHDRGEHPWAVLTHPRTGRRAFAREFYVDGGLSPLLGDRAALYGVEAAVREFVAEAEEGDSLPAALELSVAGDLQLAVQSIVDARAPELRGDTSKPRITVAVLDARSGALLAAARESRSGAEDAVRLTAWERGAALSGRQGETPLLRRGPVGSTLKVAGGYALANHGLAAGGIPPPRPGFAATESSDGDRGVMYLARAGTHGAGPRARRQCTGTHVVPLQDAAFTGAMFQERFAKSCNTFFILTGFRHASAVSARVDSRGGLPGRGELRMNASRADSLTLLHPGEEPLAERIRAGLASDFAPGARAPHSIYGILVRGGFHLDPGRPAVADTLNGAEVEVVRGVESDTLRGMAFEHGGRAVDVTFHHDWFAPAGGRRGGATPFPALEPGRDFSYPSILSPGRLDEQPTFERYNGRRMQLVHDPGQGRADVQYAMALIGQAHLTVSALGLGVLYAPAARADGRTVSPCLFTPGCGPGRAGAVVLDGGVPGARILEGALRAVLLRGGTANPRIPDERRALLERGWGGKTGTYQVELPGWPARLGPRRAWLDLVDHACGVEGVARPDVEQLARALGELSPGLDAQVLRLASSPPGAAAGALACEGARYPLNPGGVHRYRPDRGAALDRAAALVQGKSGVTPPQDYHALVLVALPSRDGGADPAGAAAGIVVSVLVDDTAHLAIPIAAEVAGAVDRWARLARTR